MDIVITLSKFMAENEVIELRPTLCRQRRQLSAERELEVSPILTILGLFQHETMSQRMKKMKSLKILPLEKIAHILFIVKTRITCRLIFLVGSL